MTSLQSHRLEIATSDAKLTAGAGEIILLTGASGSGKSVWLQRLAGLESAPSGCRIAFANDPVEKHCVRMLFDRWPPAWLGHSVAEEMAFGLNKPLSVEQLKAQLQNWQLNDIDPECNPASLNRLQSLRLALAAATLAEPDLLLLDNPTAALSYTEANEIIAALRNWLSTHQTIVVVACNRWQDWQPAASQEWRITAADVLPEYQAIPGGEA